MFTLDKAMQLLKLAEREYPSLKDEEIHIKTTGIFSAEIGLFYNVVTISESERSRFKEYAVRYFKDYEDLRDVDYMFYDFEECFAFLHELGHIYYKDMNAGEEIHYTNYKEKIYNSHYQAFKEYRNIPTEKLADQFALIVIRNRLNMIYSIMNEQPLEDAIEEVKFWSVV